jgi:hypothetical protein
MAEASIRTTKFRLLLREKNQFMTIFIGFQDNKATTVGTLSLTILLLSLSRPYSVQYVAYQIISPV